MNARRITSLVLRLTGIIILFSQLRYLLQNVLMALIKLNYRDPMGYSGHQTAAIANMNLTIFVVAPLLVLIFSILVIVKSNALAKRIAPDEQITIAPGLDADTIQALAFCIIGVVLVANAIPKLAHLANNYVLMRSIGVAVEPFHVFYGKCISVAFQVFTGAFLFFQADSLVGFWKKTRAWAREENSEAS